jgi:hypothetical protein
LHLYYANENNALHSKTQLYYLEEIWINQNHSRKSCWQMSDRRVENLDLQRRKVSDLCHAEYTATGCVLWVRLTFHSKSKRTADYHIQMNSETFKVWFVSKLLPYLKPESVIVTDSARYLSVVRSEVSTAVGFQEYCLLRCGDVTSLRKTLLCSEGGGITFCQTFVTFVSDCTASYFRKSHPPFYLQRHDAAILHYVADSAC